MADDIQSAFKEMAAIPNPNKWMLFVAIGFMAGAIFAYLVTSNLSVQAQVEDTCGVCVHNYNILAKQCQQPFSKDVPILPGYINGSVRVYAS